MTEATAITQYGEREQIKELSTRITRMLPQIRQLGETGSIALAQISYSLGLNPFVGEVWAIPQGGKNFSLMVGIKGLRRAAKYQAQKMGAIYPFYRPSYRLLSDEEKEMASIGPNDKALVCQLEVFLPPNHTFYQTNEYARCIYEGMGIVRAGTKSKMEPIQLVRKRAEADALKQAFDLPFGESTDDEAYSINGAHGTGSEWKEYPEMVDDETGEIVEEAPEVKVIEPEPEPDPEPVYFTDGVFANRGAAIRWGHEQGAFESLQDAMEAYDVLKDELQWTTTGEMTESWMAAINRRLSA